MSDCTRMTLPDGTVARVHGAITPEALQAIKDALPARCDADTGQPMIAFAQRLHKRENHGCGGPPGHAGPHRWPWKEAETDE